jgi:Na+-driven multidrug efflux pump
MVVLAGATWLARRQVVKIFTDEQGVIDLTATVVPAVASSLIGKPHMLTPQQAT